MGFIWIGTQTGLYRWDGYRYRSYTADPQTPGSLPDNLVHSLYADARGRLWVGTTSAGLARFDPTTERFTAYPVGKSGLSSANVQAIIGDGRNGLWVATDAGLDHVGPDDALQPGAVAEAMAAGLPKGSVDALLLDRSGGLWAGCGKALVRRAAGAARFEAVTFDLPDGASAGVDELYEDSAGRVWIGSRAHGAFVVEPGASHAVAVVETGPMPALATDRVMSLIEPVPGEMWLGTEGGGIMAIDLSSGTTRRIRHQSGQTAGLDDNEINAMFRDRSGLVWVATGTGVALHNPRQRVVTTLLGGSDTASGISDAKATSTLIAPDGRLWLGIGSAGVDIIDPLQGRVGQIRPDAANPRTALPKARVLAIASGADGRIYLGTRLGLYVADPATLAVRRIEVPERDPTARTAALCVDGSMLWVGGPDGLWAIDVRRPARPLLKRHEPVSQLGTGSVVSLLRGPDSALWVGTQMGLNRLDVVTGAIEQLPSDSADLTKMPAGFVSSLLIDRRGTLWVSSFGNGVLMMEGRGADGHPRFRRFGLREGLPHVGVDTLLEDQRGDIWMSTDDGLAVIARDDFSVRVLQRPQGVGLLTYWTNSGTTTPAGELIFGGQGGVSVVRPERMEPWLYRPPVVVTEAKIGDAPVPLAAMAGSTPAATPPRLDVGSDARGLWMEFSTLDYSAPERNRYAHRLQGFDADWVASDSTRRLASYTNLPPGEYTLQLRGSNRDGVWSEPMSIPIRVLPAWYQTLWFRGLAGAAALLCIAGLVQARTVFLRRRQRELEGLVAARTAELERRSEELHESQRQLEKLAYADPLTGLPNRRLFSENLRHQVAQGQREGGSFALLLIDLDGFKRINDTLGHDAGDALLVVVAGRLSREMRGADRVARLGGDEFAVLMTQPSDTPAIDSVCRRIIASLGEPVPFKGMTLRVGASIGVALRPDHGDSPDVLYKSADLALYAAKRGGRNTWRWHDNTRALLPMPNADVPAG